VSTRSTNSKSVSSRSLNVIRVSLRSKQVQTHNPHDMACLCGTHLHKAAPVFRRRGAGRRGCIAAGHGARVVPEFALLLTAFQQPKPAPRPRAEGQGARAMLRPTTQTHAQTSYRRPRSSRRASTSPALVAASPAPSEPAPRQWPWRSCLAGNFFMNEFRPGSCSTSVASSNNGSSSGSQPVRWPLGSELAPHQCPCWCFMSAGMDLSDTL
jgi:hypothetical protein